MHSAVKGLTSTKQSFELPKQNREREREVNIADRSELQRNERKISNGLVTFRGNISFRLAREPAPRPGLYFHFSLHNGLY